jgi:hypothetical protein
MVGLLKGELKKIWKEATVAYSTYYSGNCLKVQGKARTAYDTVEIRTESSRIQTYAAILLPNCSVNMIF